MISVQPTIGPFYGNVPINVVGKMFGLKPENQTVTIGGVACPSTRYVSSELLQCDLPPGSGISQDVSVIVDNQSVSGGDLFSYQGGGKSFTEQTCSIKSVFVFPRSDMSLLLLSFCRSFDYVSRTRYGPDSWWDDDSDHRL